MRRMKMGDEVRFGYFIPQTYWARAAVSGLTKLCWVFSILIICQKLRKYFNLCRNINLQPKLCWNGAKICREFADYWQQHPGHEIKLRIYSWTFEVSITILMSWLSSYESFIQASTYTELTWKLSLDQLADDVCKRGVFANWQISKNGHQKSPEYSSQYKLYEPG